MFRTLPDKKKVSECDFPHYMKAVDERFMYSCNGKFTHDGQQVETSLFEEGCIHEIFITTQHIILHLQFQIEILDKMENLLWCWSIFDCNLFLLDDSTLLAIKRDGMTGYSFQGKRLFKRHLDTSSLITGTWHTFVYALLDCQIVAYQHH